MTTLNDVPLFGCMVVYIMWNKFLPMYKNWIFKTNFAREMALLDHVISGIYPAMLQDTWLWLNHTGWTNRCPMRNCDVLSHRPCLGVMTSKRSYCSVGDNNSGSSQTQCIFYHSICCIRTGEYISLKKEQRMALKAVLNRKYVKLLLIWLVVVSLWSMVIDRWFIQ